MRENFDIAFKITIGLEGKPSNLLNDPGGFTIWGLAKKYHPWITMNTTLDEAKKVYLEEYWLPAGCDEAPFPMDICLFDSQVNPQKDPALPGAGNKQLLLQMKDKSDWKEYNLRRMIRYMHCSKHDFVLGHLCRVLRLSDQILNSLDEETDNE
jgi:hypothetical protein